LINANRIKNLDGTNATTEWKEGDPLISIKKFISINKTEDLKQYNLSDLLATSVQRTAPPIMAEGIWEVNARVSAITQYPKLVDMDGGPTPVDEAAGYPEGTMEYLTNTFVVNAAAVVQWNATYLSAISSSPKPGTELKVSSGLCLQAGRPPGNGVYFRNLAYVESAHNAARSHLQHWLQC
jgi:hypothetical protein